MQPSGSHEAAGTEEAPTPTPPGSEPPPPPGTPPQSQSVQGPQGAEEAPGISPPSSQPSHPWTSPERESLQGAAAASPEAPGSPEPRRWHTDCLERPLALGFRRLGLAVGTHPWPFLLLPMALTAVLGGGFAFLPAEDVDDQEEHYTPVASPAKTERAFVQEHFANPDAAHFIPSRQSTEAHFLSVIAVAEPGLLLRPDTLPKLARLDKTVRAVAAGNGSRITYQKVCASYHGSCIEGNPLLSLWEAEGKLDLSGLSFPLYQHSSGNILALLGYVGGPHLRPYEPKGEVGREIQALRLLYFLKTEDSGDNEQSKLWLLAFLEKIKEIKLDPNLKDIQVLEAQDSERQPLSRSRILELPCAPATLVLRLT